MRVDLIELLADGELHSGADLARTLRCSRTAIWKQLQQLASVDLEIEAAPGQGYRLTRRLDLLDGDAIRAALAPGVGAGTALLDILSITESTNEFLRAAGTPPPGRMSLAFAEYQSGGRGRRGRRWLSPFASGLCMSTGWTFPVMPPNLAALSLAAGVAVYRALSNWEPAGLALKWPNDIVAANSKLGGMLIDVQGESSGPVFVIVGIGINVEPVERLAERFDTPDCLRPVGLRSLIGDRNLSRNALAAAIASELFVVLIEFQSSGFRTFADEWRGLDAMRGKPVSLRIADREQSGISAGIDDDGALLLDDGGNLNAVVAGEVTLRQASGESGS
ncbi:MAG: biotin--[acetyl-CoA-carboxylase] ligase [Gammaproteobacteria bacterium]|nr:biotin--[acetyl-CoA-carboxylase] ligase [Gammaproteobacteria bacterium]MBT8444514.1 biotin--[acetyl-CoA-carboxylase] ligase [Gammaproteobacteria bacterium]NND35596.1 biotin--[acetyl-CoA-carboxylase] ligase [Gammaproteobacteria bacterium]